MPKIAASERDAFYETRRQELAEAALRLWAEKGFDQTSVAAIAREAGLAKGTFYLYFESKQALLFEVVRKNSLLPNALRLIEALQHKSLEEAVPEFVEGAWEQLSENRELVRVLMRELPTHMEEVHQLIERILVPGNLALAGFLEQHLSDERSEELATPIAVRALIGSLVAVFLTQDILGADRFVPVSRGEITRTISEVFLRGVLHEGSGTS